KRRTSDLKDIRVFLILYNSLVRSILEYNSVVWSPYYVTHTDRLEAVQLHFLKFIKYKLSQQNIYFDQLSLVADYVSLSSLQKRRNFLKLCFVFKAPRARTGCSISTSSTILNLYFGLCAQ